LYEKQLNEHQFRWRDCNQITGIQLLELLKMVSAKHVWAV